MEREKQKVFLMYAGLDPKEGHWYVHLEGIQEPKELKNVSAEYLESMLETRMYKWPKPLFNGRPGLVYTMIGSFEAGSLMGVDHDREFVTRLTGGEISHVLVELQTRHDAIKGKREISRYLKKEGAVNVWQEAMQPIRQAYLDNPRHRVQIIAMVIQFITRGAK